MIDTFYWEHNDAHQPATYQIKKERKKGTRTLLCTKTSFLGIWELI